MRDLINALLFLLSFIIAGLLIFTFSTPAIADGRDMYGERLRESTVTVEFSLDEQPITASPIVKFELWCIFVPGSAVQELVATLNDPTVRVWTLDPTDLPIGTDLPYYMKVIYEDNHVGWSESAYMFAVTKSPAINRVGAVKSTIVGERVSLVSFSFIADAQASTYDMFLKTPNGQEVLLGNSTVSGVTGSLQKWESQVSIPNGKNSFFFKGYDGNIELGTSNLLTYVK